jgi:hypothetical protein
MAKNLVLLDYTFLFDPSGTYSHLYQFEQDLNKFYSEHGMEMQTIKTMEGGVGRRVAYITPKTNDVKAIGETVTKLKPGDVLTAKPIGRPRSSGSMLKQLAHRELRAPAKAFMGKK